MSKDRFEWDDKLVREFQHFVYPLSYDSLNPYGMIEKFKASKQPKEPERIEVNWRGYNMSAEHPYTHSFVTTEPIPKEKFPAIKAAIEQVLNDDGNGIDRMMMVLNAQWAVQLEAVKKYQSYTEKDLEDAFNAGKRNGFCKEWNFRDYLNQLKSK